MTTKFPHRPRQRGKQCKNRSTKRRSSAWNDLVCIVGRGNPGSQTEIRSTLFLYTPRPMKLIEHNPFRMLGIPVNASAKDLASNKGKMRLLDIGKDVSFPLDLPDLLQNINRTKETVATAEREINLPQDKIKHALFWFAQPTEPIGKLAYDHLLQGNNEKALELFSKSHSWEALLCRSILELQAGKYGEALLDFYSITNGLYSQMCHAIAGQTFGMSASDLIKLYLQTLTEEVEASTLLQEWGKNTVLPGGSKIIEFELRNIAIEKPLGIIEKEMAACKAINTDDAEAQLEAGKKLANNTHKVRIQLQKMVGDDDPRYSRLVDKLANQIMQCSINYFNKKEDENREIIENALKLGEYALKIAVGKMARDHIQHNVDILRKKKENLPPAEVENEMEIVQNAILSFLKNPGEKTISLTHENDRTNRSLNLLNATKQSLQSIKQKLAEDNPFYLKTSTQVVGLALGNIIGEVNDNQNLLIHASQNASPQVKATIIRVNVQPVVNNAWKAIRIMDGFDMENDFRQNRYLPNRTTLKNIYDTLNTATGGNSGGGDGGGCYIATMVYGDYNHPQVMVLRGFRDDVLQKNPIGRAFVRFYYKYSPTWVEHLKDKKRINNFIRTTLDSFIKIYRNEE